MLMAAGFLIRDILRRLRSDEDDHATYRIRAGAVTGLVARPRPAAIAIQELVDFSLQMPGNMVMFVVL